MREYQRMTWLKRGGVLVLLAVALLILSISVFANPVGSEYGCCLNGVVGSTTTQAACSHVWHRGSVAAPFINCMTIQECPEVIGAANNAYCLCDDIVTDGAYRKTDGGICDTTAGATPNINIFNPLFTPTAMIFERWEDPEQHYTGFPKESYQYMSGESIAFYEWCNSGNGCGNGCSHKRRANVVSFIYINEDLQFRYYVDDDYVFEIFRVQYSPDGSVPGGYTNDLDFFMNAQTHFYYVPLAPTQENWGGGLRGQILDTTLDPYLASGTNPGYVIKTASEGYVRNQDHTKQWPHAVQTITLTPGQYLVVSYVSDAWHQCEGDGQYFQAALRFLRNDGNGGDPVFYMSHLPMDSWDALGILSSIDKSFGLINDRVTSYNSIFSSGNGILPSLKHLGNSFTDYYDFICQTHRGDAANYWRDEASSQSMHCCDAEDEGLLRITATEVERCTSTGWESLEGEVECVDQQGTPIPGTDFNFEIFSRYNSPNSQNGRDGCCGDDDIFREIDVTDWESTTSSMTLSGTGDALTINVNSAVTGQEVESNNVLWGNMGATHINFIMSGQLTVSTPFTGTVSVIARYQLQEQGYFEKVVFTTTNPGTFTFSSGLNDLYQEPDYWVSAIHYQIKITSNSAATISVDDMHIVRTRDFGWATIEKDWLCDYDTDGWVWKKAASGQQFQINPTGPIDTITNTVDWFFCDAGEREVMGRRA